MTETLQGPTPGVRLIEVRSVKRELTVQRTMSVKVHLCIFHQPMHMRICQKPQLTYIIFNRMLDW